MVSNEKISLRKKPLLDIFKQVPTIFSHFCLASMQRRWLGTMVLCLIWRFSAQAVGLAATQPASEQSLQIISQPQNATLALAYVNLADVTSTQLKYSRQEILENTVSGWIWHDINHNGLLDNNEPGLAGIKVELWGKPPDLPFQLCTSAPTDSIGYYAFNNAYAPWCMTVHVPPSAKYPYITNHDDYTFGLYEGVKIWLPVIER